jgi:phosphoribosylformylglycinamidine (FGAM) synthase-like amidotransferase family enzyme
MNKVNALILTGYGLNCDHETAYCFELAGARATRVHINSLKKGIWYWEYATVFRPL